MADNSTFKQSLDRILKEAISKNAALSTELKSIIEMLIDHEKRITELEKNNKRFKG